MKASFTPSTDILQAILVGHGGLSRQTKFNVIITPPGGLNSASALQDISILCDACSLPIHQIITTDYATVKQSQKIPNGYSNDDVTFSFVQTADMFVRKFFDAWISLPIDRDTYRVPYQETYAGTIVIQQLNQENEVIYSIRLNNAYPVSIHNIQFDSSATDTSERLSVTITYDDYTIL